MFQNYYLCVIEHCTRRFIRRGYLLVHLQKVHLFDAVTVRKHAHNVSSDRVVDECVTKKDCRQDAAAYYPEVEDISDDESCVSDAGIQQLQNPEVQSLLEDIERDTNNNSKPIIVGNYLEELCKGDSVVNKDTKTVSQTVSSVGENCDKSSPGMDVDCEEQSDIRRVVISEAT